MLFERLGHFVVAHRWAVLLGLLVLTVASAAIAPGLRFDFTPQALFEQRDEVNDFAREIREHFGDETNTLIVVWQHDELYAAQTLEDLAVVTDALEAWPHATRVLSLSNMRLPRNEVDAQSGERVLQLGPLVGHRPVTDALAERIRDQVDGEPLLERALVSRSGTRTAIVIELGESARNINELTTVVGELDDKLAAWSRELPSAPTLTLSGLPQVRVDIIQNLQNEQLRFLPLTALFIIAMLAWMFRSVSGVLLPLGSIALALIWTTAMLVVVGQPINIINSVLPTLLMIIGLSDGIHLLSRAAEEAASGASREDIVRSTVRRIGLACFLTSATTAIGFVSLLMSSAAILRDFGVHTAAGVMLAYLATILFIPALLTWMPAPRRVGLHQDRPGLIERLMAKNARLVLARPLPLLAAGLLVGAAAVTAALTWGRIDTRLLEVYPDDHDTAVLTRMVNDEFSGVLPLIVSIEAREPGYFLEPDNLEKLATLQRSVEAHDPGMILKTGSVYDLLQVFRAAFLDDPSLRDTPFETRQQIEAVLRLYRQDAASDVNRLLDADNRHALVTIRLDDLGIERGKATVAHIAREAERLFGEGAADGITEARPPANGDVAVRVRLAGDIYLASAGLTNFIWDLLGSLSMAAIIIFAVMTVLFRSLRLGLVSIPPNVLPLVLTWGYMSLRGIELNTTTVVIFSVSLGLAVDDTIHFLTRYQEERNEGYDVRTAIERTFLGAGRAIIITSVVLVGGLAILLNTNFNPTSHFAELTTCTVVGALIGDLFVLPACLLLFDGRERKGQTVRLADAEASERKDRAATPV